MICDLLVVTEVLKQVWDLSDQDSDSMLSLREFCFALYMMERHREGHPLPTALPSNVMYDETLLSMTGLPNVAYGNAAWGASSGIVHIFLSCFRDGPFLGKACDDKVFGGFYIRF